jgi:hypothetical protein
LRGKGYLPIIFDFPAPEDRTFTETVKTLVALSRFVIADMSGPSVPQELTATVPHFQVPFVPILERGRKLTSMAPDLFLYPWVISPPISFADTADLISRLSDEIIGPAEKKVEEWQQVRKELCGPQG